MAAAYIGTRRGRRRAKEAEAYDVEMFPSDEDVIMVGELQRQVMRYVELKCTLRHAESPAAPSATPGSRGRLSCPAAS